MKQNILMLIVSLLIPILSFSQNTYPRISKDSLIVLTPLQLKQTNLIFVEHSYLLECNDKLEENVLIMDSIINNLEMSSYYYDEAVGIYKDSVLIKNLEINSLKSKIKNNNTIHKISGTLIVILLTLLII